MEKIESVEDQDKFLAQNSIKYLNSLTKIKELNDPTLKSLYRTKCKLMELRRHVFLPEGKPNYRCQRCFMNFSEGPTKYEVRSVKLSDFDIKVLKKVKNERSLTTFQRIYYKKLKKKFPNGFGRQNKMVITCSFCKKESEIWMTKPKKTSAFNKKVVTPAKKKKISRKDRFCGLNENAVLQSTSKKNKQGNHDQNQGQTRVNGTIAAYSSENRSNINFNASVSMTNTRVFDTADFIPLEIGKKNKNKIKFSNRNLSKNKSQLHINSKSKEKLQQKNLKTLGNILQRASEKKSGQPSTLKNFLAGL